MLCYDNSGRNLLWMDRRRSFSLDGSPLRWRELCRVSVYVEVYKRLSLRHTGTQFTFPDSGELCLTYEHSPKLYGIGSCITECSNEEQRRTSTSHAISYFRSLPCTWRSHGWRAAGDSMQWVNRRSSENQFSLPHVRCKLRGVLRYPSSHRETSRTSDRCPVMPP